MQHRLLTIHCLSPLHCGTGQGIAGIDLPIQRERHTGWPVIPGSSIKGVLRDAYRGSLGGADKNSDTRTVALFGPEPKGEVNDLGLGALTLGDAILLAFPVRSLCGVFAWCTCPMALGRVARLSGAEALADGAKLTVGQEELLGAKDLAAHDQKAVLEDHALAWKPLPSGLVEVLTRFWIPSAAAMLERHLAVVSDDLFTWFARHATQVEARIALDPATKTVNDGQLFYEETVPPEAVFVAPVAAEHARHPNAEEALRPADAAMGALRKLIDARKSLQFGGKATIGRGQCAVRLTGGK